MWETPQELPVPDSPLGKGLLSVNLASPPLLHTASHLPLDPYSAEREGERGVLLPEHLLEGH